MGSSPRLDCGVVSWKCWKCRPSEWVEGKAFSLEMIFNAPIHFWLKSLWTRLINPPVNGLASSASMHNRWCEILWHLVKSSHFYTPMEHWHYYRLIYFNKGDAQCAWGLSSARGQTLGKTCTSHSVRCCFHARRKQQDVKCHHHKSAQTSTLGLKFKLRHMPDIHMHNWR